MPIDPNDPAPKRFEDFFKKPGMIEVHVGGDPAQASASGRPAHKCLMLCQPKTTIGGLPCGDGVRTAWIIEGDDRFAKYTNWLNGVGNAALRNVLVIAAYTAPIYLSPMGAAVLMAGGAVGAIALSRKLYAEEKQLIVKGARDPAFRAAVNAGDLSILPPRAAFYARAAEHAVHLGGPDDKEGRPGLQTIFFQSRWKGVPGQSKVGTIVAGTDRCDAITRVLQAERKALVGRAMINYGMGAFFLIMWPGTVSAGALYFIAAPAAIGLVAKYKAHQLKKQAAADPAFRAKDPAGFFGMMFESQRDPAATQAKLDKMKADAKAKKDAQDNNKKPPPTANLLSGFKRGKPPTVADMADRGRRPGPR